jgi:hypothetical protein
MRLTKEVVVVAALAMAATTSVAEDAGSPTADEPGCSNQAVRLATHALAEKLHVDPGTIELISVDAETWPGPGVQCGQSVTAEEQPLTSGHRVRLRIESGAFEVRVAEGIARVCGVGPDAAAVERGRIDPALQNLVEQAKLDLASRQNTILEKIEVLEAVSVVWRDSGVGCPKPGMDYLQVLTKGTRIRLRFGPAVFHYHGVGKGPPVYCEQPAKIEPLPGATFTE